MTTQPNALEQAWNNFQRTPVYGGSSALLGAFGVKLPQAPIASPIPDYQTLTPSLIYKIKQDQY